MTLTFTSPECHQSSGVQERSSGAPRRQRLSKKKGPPKSQGSQSTRPILSADGTRWWTILNQDDPISLEPLAKLPYPPFALRNLPQNETEQESQTGDFLPGKLARNTECHPHKLLGARQPQQQLPRAGAECITHFDGRVLAHYLVSTLSFVHPITRRDLTLSECEQLDDYLKAYRLGRPRVVQAFQRKDEQHSTMATSDVDLQSESAALLQSLFSSTRRTHTPAGRNASAIRNARRLQAVVMNLHHAVDAVETEETANDALLVRSESARDPPVHSAASTLVQPGDHGMMQYPTLHGRCPSQVEYQPKGSWCAPVLTAASSPVNVARDFPTLSECGILQRQSKRPMRMHQCWGRSTGPRKPLTMADLLDRFQ